MPPAPARHLLTVWDPSRGPDPMQAHLELLLAQRRRHAAGAVDDDDVYVWWGKIRSPNRQQRLPHLAEILALDAPLRAADGPDAEVHLYLTDYRSLYVGHVTEVTADDDVREEGPEFVPALYDDVACDCWFRLMDLRRLVHDSTLDVIAELRRLRNVRYHDRPVSLYGGMVELPLVVTRDDDARWFDPGVRAMLLDGRSWAEFDAERTGLGQVERTLRDDLFGAEAWAGLDPAARTFVASAEKVYRDLRDDPAFDFSPVLVNLAKAVEVQANVLLRLGLRGTPEAARLANVDGRTVDAGEDGPFTLGQLARIIADERPVNDALRRGLANGPWIAESLPPIMAELAAVRNPAAHSAKLERREVGRLRDRLVGVGCAGDLVALGRAGAGR